MLREKSVEWSNPNVAFYDRAPKSKIKSSYWFFLLHSFSNSPKVCITVPKCNLAHVVENKSLRGRKTEKNSSLLNMWIYENGKFKKEDIMDVTEVYEQKDKLRFKTESGLEVICSKKYPNQNLVCYKKGKEFFNVSSKSSSFKEKFKLNYDGVKFSDKGDSFAKLEKLRFPQHARLFDLFSSYTGRVDGKKSKGILWCERWSGVTSYIPWKYSQVHFEKGVSIAFSNSYLFPRNLKVMFLKSKKYYYFKKTIHYDYYSDLRGVPHTKIQKDTKYVVLKADNGKGVRVNITMELLDKHKYEASIIPIATSGIWWQMVFKIKDVLVVDGDKTYTKKDLGRYSAYAEDSYLTKVLGINRRVLKG